MLPRPLILFFASFFMSLHASNACAVDWQPVSAIRPDGSGLFLDLDGIVPGHAQGEFQVRIPRTVEMRPALAGSAAEKVLALACPVLSAARP